MAYQDNPKNILSDDEVRNLVAARLSVLSQDTIISLGSAGSFPRNELIVHVEQKDAIGNKLAEIQLEWLRSLRKKRMKMLADQAAA